MQAQPYLSQIIPDSPDISNLLWSLPEQKTGTLNIIGGSSNNFSNTIRLSEFAKRFTFQNVYTILPDSTRSLFPPDLINLKFAPSTTSGSFDSSRALSDFLSTGTVNLFIGEVSKNSATSIALAHELSTAEKPTIITRDTVDTVTPEAMNFINNPNLIFISSVLQLQKLFRAVFFPKILLLSMPFLQITEILHKFTISYPVTILTFHNNNIIVASNGNVNHCKIDQTSYTPLSLWSGHLAVKTAALLSIKPQNPLAATSAAIFYH